jgi:hypothetical protein
MPRKLTDTVQLKLRFDEKLRRRLEREANQNKRSMNAEIIDRLEKSFAKQDEGKLLAAVTATTAEVQALRIAFEGRINSPGDVRKTPGPPNWTKSEESPAHEKPASKKD